MANENLNSWDNFTGGTFLKAENVKSESDIFVVLDVQEVEDTRDGKDVKRVRLVLEKGEDDFLLDLNKTNAQFLKEKGIKSPKELLGKKINFRKALVRDPSKNKEVEGIRVCKVE